MVMYVRMRFSNCVATDISDVAWKQAQLGLSYGGLGLHSISHHSCVAYIASLSFSGLGSADNPHLMRSIVKYNGLVSPPDGISVESILASPIPQRILSQRLDDHSFGLVITVQKIGYTLLYILRIFRVYARIYACVYAKYPTGVFCV